MLPTPGPVSGANRLERNLMSSFRLAGVVALSALLVAVSGAAFAAPPTPSSGPIAGGTTVTGTLTGVTFTQVTAGGFHSLAVGSDGHTYAWGYNGNGQLGNGTNTDSSVPVVVSTPAGVTFTQLAAGRSHSLAVGSDGNTYAWGNGSYGQLGNGALTNSSMPVKVSTPAGVTFTQVAAGYTYSLAVGSDGNTYAWGNGGNGQLGNGTNTDSSVPVKVSTPAGVTFTHVAAGGNHSLAVGSDGNTYAWGYNGNGQLGNGTTTNSSVPVKVSTPAGVTFTQVAAGDRHSLAVGSDGNTYAWGYNSDGELGNGTITNSSMPLKVSTPAGVTFTQVSAGSGHSLAVSSDGNTYAWGYNGDGELGNGTTTQSSVPVAAGTPVVTGVTFSGAPGTGLTQTAGSWSVVTPAHAAGPVDVVVSYTQFGAANTVTTVAGFTYNPAPAPATPVAAPATAVAGIAHFAG